VCWTEQVSAERLRLLQAERQLRLGLETRTEWSANVIAHAENVITRAEAELATLRETERQLRFQLVEALARGEAAAARAQSIEASTVWRASSVLRRALNSHPGLRRCIKTIARPMVRALRWGLGRGRNRLAGH
jgi:hypothetical protein